jgi:hypothetical protein
MVAYMEMTDKQVYFLVDYWYDELDNPIGGGLHIVLEDGNTEHGNIWYCMQELEKEGNSFGVFLCAILLSISEDKLRDMYEKDAFGQKTVVIID